MTRDAKKQGRVFRSIELRANRSREFVLRFRFTRGENRDIIRQTFFDAAITDAIGDAEQRHRVKPAKLRTPIAIGFQCLRP